MSELPSPITCEKHQSSCYTRHVDGQAESARTPFVKHGQEMIVGCKAGLWKEKNIAVTATFLAELWATALIIQSLLLWSGSMHRFTLISLPVHPNAGPDLTYTHLGEVISSTGDIHQPEHPISMGEQPSFPALN